MVGRDKDGKFIKGHIHSALGRRKNRVCAGCGKIFQKEVKTKYCSAFCWKEHMGQALSKGWHSEKRKIWFVTGFPAHQKNKLVRKGESHHNWKGDSAGYEAIHGWIVRNLGKADHCSFNPYHKSTRYHWANISGNYMRDTDDYASLCPACHKTYDLVVRKISDKKCYSTRQKHQL
jgi:hypothetical protein